MDDTTTKPDSYLSDNIANESNELNEINEDAQNLLDDKQQTNLQTVIESSSTVNPDSSDIIEDLGQTNNDDDGLEDISVGTFDESSQASQPLEDNSNNQIEYSNEQNDDIIQTTENEFEALDDDHGESSIADIQNDIIDYQENIEELKQDTTTSEMNEEEHLEDDAGLENLQYSNVDLEDEPNTLELPDESNENIEVREETEDNKETEVVESTENMEVQEETSDHAIEQDNIEEHDEEEEDTSENVEVPEEASNEVIEVPEKITEKSHDNLPSRGINENQEDFEEVDANLSTNSAHENIPEDNMLGEADNTLNIEQLSEKIQEKAADDHETNVVEENSSLMEVDEEEDSTLLQNESKDEQEPPNDVNEDVEMASPSELSNQENNQKESNVDDEMETLEESKEPINNDGPNDDDNDGGNDVVDTPIQTEDMSYNELEQIRQELSADLQDNQTNENQNKEQPKKQKKQRPAQENIPPTNEDYQDNENESVENVQEPEESDVCLIPDDQDKEVTDAEKEQAILAREEAEKEDETPETATTASSLPDKDAENKEIEEQEETQANQKDSSSQVYAEAPVEKALKARAAEVTAIKFKKKVSTGEVVQNVNNEQQNELPDPEEPLLEEMHPSTVGDAALTKVIISWTVTSRRKCKQCNRSKLCGFRCKSVDNPDAYEYLCDQNCCDSLMSTNPGKYFIRRKKFLLDEVNEEHTSSSGTKSSKKQSCIQCRDTKVCKYFFKQDDDTFYLCNDKCYNILNMNEPDKYKLKRHSIRVRNIGATSINSIVENTPPITRPSASSSNSASSSASASNSHSTSKVKGSAAPSADSRVVARTAAEAEAAKQERVASFRRRCAECFKEVSIGEKNLLWETLDFCNEICLGKYQRTLGARCQTCDGDVPHQALGKYCVRFGFDIRQFCCASCLNEFKKGLKTCSCCQKDISSGNEGFLAPVGDKEQFKDFCSQACMRRYDAMCNPKKKLRNDICAVCNIMKPVRTEIILDFKEHTFCSNPCFSAFKFVSNIVADQCGMCAKYFERKGNESFTIYSEHRVKVFCTRVCLNVYIIVNRRIVSCQWCKVKKYNFDMIYKKQDNQDILMCSLNCLTLYGVSLNAFSRTTTNCDNCQKLATPQYHLTMSDASMRNFCTYQCVMQFQSQFARAPLTLDAEGNTTVSNNQHKMSSIGGNAANSRNNAPFPTGLPKRIKLKHQQAAAQSPQSVTPSQKQSSNAKLKITGGKNAANKKVPNMPVISAVSSLASGDTETMMPTNVSVRRNAVRMRKIDSPPPPPSPSLSSSQSTAATSSQGTMTGRVSRTRKSLADYRQRSPTPPPMPAPATPAPLPPPTLRGRVRKSIPDYRQDTPSPPVPASTPPPVISLRSSVNSTSSKRLAATSPAPSTPVKEPITKVIMVPPMPAPVRNVATSCKPATVEVGFQIEPRTIDSSTQTGKDYSNKVLIPVPVPIFIPQPMYMYSSPFPVPVPFPLPIPVPIFVPTTRNSAQGILKEIKKIQDKMPTDPLEAELLMMAEMVADDKGESDSGSEDEIKPDPGVVNISYSSNDQHLTTHAQVEAINHGYGEDMLQMALKMATGEYDQPSEDLESAMTANTIQNPPPGMVVPHDEALHIDVHGLQQGQIVRKRSAIMSPVPLDNRSPAKRQRLLEMDQMGANQAILRTNKPVLVKPDQNMCLKYTFGVNAWKQWVVTKNADIEKSSVKRRPFKTELLQMTADELNYSLCLFVKEVRKPNGTEYAPDTIYYLVLGIQQYLYENGRIDNIFTDSYYERFTDCLDEVARRFSILYNDSQYIVTRVEEEHLWECKQLGAHSPHVLLSTLMFFNTKHFNLTTVEEHMQLSFSHIMKHWKRTTQNAKVQGTRNVLLRFYPPQAGLDANPRKKKVYEQQENEENPLRCPVRLYEFYLSKCPESVKTRNDVFYLQPERSCVPDSPVWYSTQALSKEALEKMLHRVKMVKEINIALLTS